MLGDVKIEIAVEPGEDKPVLVNALENAFFLGKPLKLKSKGEAYDVFVGSDKSVSLEFGHTVYRYCCALRSIEKEGK